MSEQERAPSAIQDWAKARGWDQPRLEALLCCDFSSRTLEGKHNLLGVFNRVILHTPAHQFWVYVRTMFTSHGVIVITGYDPDGTVGGTYELELADAPEVQGDASIELVMPFIVTRDKPGTHWFEVSFNGRSLGQAPVMVGVMTEGNNGSNSIPTSL